MCVPVRALVHVCWSVHVHNVGVCMLCAQFMCVSVVLEFVWKLFWARTFANGVHVCLCGRGCGRCTCVNA